MNERIRELAKQAGFYVSANGAEILIPDPHTEDITEVTKKFAELIVRKCARVAMNTDLEDLEGGARDSWDRGFLHGLHYAMNTIKEHFGVEE